MKTPKAAPDEKPENTDKLTPPKQAETDSQAVTRKFKATPAFDLSDDADLDQIRQAMIDNEARESGSDYPKDGDPFFDTSGDPLPGQSEGTRPDLNKPEVSEEKTTAPGDSETAREHSFTLFTENDFDFPVEADSPALDQTNKKPEPESPGTEQAQPGSWDQIDTQDSSDDELTQRINALRIDNSPALLSSTPATPPFVMDELSGLDEGRDTLPDKIRRGLVPPETLQLLITQSMCESEVVAVSKELGIDWNLIPGKNREEKTQFLVEYFRNKDKSGHQEQRAVIEISRPLFQTRNTEDDWRESDSRLQALQETLSLPTVPIAEQKVSIFTRLKDDFEQSGRLAKGLTIGLSILAVVLILVILYFLFTANQKKPAAPEPAIAPISTQGPFPKTIQFPGGWNFDLQVGLVQGGKWNPTGAEWLQGTEVCRLVSLPWNKQLSAVFQTFTAGDEILLTMSNEDLLSYKVESIQSINLNELNKLTNRDTPCLIVILTQKETNARQVVVSVPDFSSNSSTAIMTETKLPVTPLQITETPVKPVTPTP